MPFWNGLSRTFFFLGVGGCLFSEFIYIYVCVSIFVFIFIFFPFLQLLQPLGTDCQLKLSVIYSLKYISIHAKVHCPPVLENMLPCNHSHGVTLTLQMGQAQV